MRKLDIGVKRLALPLQDNFCDCGLFLLTYTDYFTHSLPPAIRTKNRKSLEPNELEGRWQCPSINMLQEQVVTSASQW